MVVSLRMQVLGSASGVVDMLVQHVPSSKRATARKVLHDYTGPMDSEVGQPRSRLEVFYLKQNTRVQLSGERG